MKICEKLNKKNPGKGLILSAAVMVALLFLSATIPTVQAGLLPAGDPFWGFQMIRL